jgi:hypothetical protein
MRITSGFGFDDAIGRSFGREIHFTHLTLFNVHLPIAGFGLYCNCFLYRILWINDSLAR